MYFSFLAERRWVFASVPYATKYNKEHINKQSIKIAMPYYDKELWLPYQNFPVRAMTSRVCLISSSSKSDLGSETLKSKWDTTLVIFLIFYW